MVFPQVPCFLLSNRVIQGLESNHGLGPTIYDVEESKKVDFFGEAHERAHVSFLFASFPFFRGYDDNLQRFVYILSIICIYTLTIIIQHWVLGLASVTCLSLKVIKTVDNP